MRILEPAKFKLQPMNSSSFLPTAAQSPFPWLGIRAYYTRPPKIAQNGSSSETVRAYIGR